MTAAAPLSAQLPRPGDMIAGKYILENLLGQGGMGAVFAATHVKLQKRVAIKIMLADTSNPEAAQRFLNEGRNAATIQNEHVVRVDDVDEEMGYAYMVLELLDGEDLSQVLERELTKRLKPHVAADYVLQGLRGVQQAHALGIVHRDLKPSNLYLAKRKDGSVIVKVLDFGISKSQNASALQQSPSALTSTKAMLGSPLYMSPEQLRSSKSVDHRADIWAIGVILYELITGTLPFMGDNLGELFAAILEDDPPLLRQRAPDAPPGLEQVVHRCLQRKPEQRFQSAAELALALAPFAGAQAFSNTGANNVPSAPVLAGTSILRGAGAVTPGSGLHQSHPQPPQQHPYQSTPGTMALGAITPHPGMIQTGSGWQSTGNKLKTADVDPPKKSNTTAIVGAVLGGLLAIGLLTTGVALMVRHKKQVIEDPVVATNGVPSSTPTIPSANGAGTIPDPPASVAAAASSSPTPPTPPTNTAAVAATTAAVAAPTTAKRSPPNPPPVNPTHDPTPPTPKTADPVQTTRKVTPPPTPSSNLQGSR